MTQTIKRMHLRIAIGAVICLVALALWIFAGTPLHAAPVHTPRAESAAMPVAFSEGTAHGFLELSTAAGVLLAHGDLLQTVKDGVVDSRMVFHFANSVYEETTTYTQKGVFTLLSYHLVQSGPVFPEDIEETLERSGAYTVKTKSHKDGEVDKHAGTLKLPADVYNGMVTTIAKNIAPGTSETVHIVAFEPSARVIQLEYFPAGTEHVLLGTHQETAMHIILKPKLGVLLKTAAKVMGKMPPNSDLWIVTDQVPAFVRFQGPMYTGPVWRLDLTSPSWPR